MLRGDDNRQGLGVFLTSSSCSNETPSGSRTDAKGKSCGPRVFG